MNDNGARNGGSARNQAIEAEAQAWLVRLYSGEDADAARASFRAWLNEDDRHRAAFQRVHDLWQSLTKTETVEAGLPEPAEESPAQETAAAPPFGRQAERARRTVPVFAAAAAAVVAFIAALVFGLIPAQHERARYATAIGETRIVDLPDGSRLTLGAETTLEVVFSRTDRSVALARGRAFFDVAPDPRRTFRVTAGETRVAVVGTEFEVAKRRDNISVSVREGVVAVRARRGEDAPPDRELGAGQKVVASLSGELGRTLAFDSGESLAWRQGHLSYTNARLGDVIADFNRYRADKSSFADRELEDLVVTVAGDAGQIDQMLAGIAALEGLALREAPSGPVLSVNGN